MYLSLVKQYCVGNEFSYFKKAAAQTQLGSDTDLICLIDCDAAAGMNRWIFRCRVGLLVPGQIGSKVPMDVSKELAVLYDLLALLLDDAQEVDEQLRHPPGQRRRGLGDGVAGVVEDAPARA